MVEDGKLKDLKAKNYLFQAIDRGIIETILTKNTANEIWDSMKQRYQGSTKVKRAQLQEIRKDYEMLHMKEDETVNEFFSRTLVVVNKMEMHEESVQQLTVVEKNLRSMSARFENVVCSIEEANDITSMSIEELQSKLLVHEARMKGHKEIDQEEQALKVAGAANGGRYGSRGRGRGRGRGRKDQNKESVECYKCGKLGHHKNECPSWEEGENFAEFDE